MRIREKSGWGSLVCERVGSPSLPTPLVSACWYCCWGAHVLFGRPVRGSCWGGVFFALQHCQFLLPGRVCGGLLFFGLACRRLLLSRAAVSLEIRGSTSASGSIDTLYQVQNVSAAFDKSC